MKNNYFFRQDFCEKSGTFFMQNAELYNRIKYRDIYSHLLFQAKNCYCKSMYFKVQSVLMDMISSLNTDDKCS